MKIKNTFAKYLGYIFKQRILQTIVMAMISILLVQSVLLTYIGKRKIEMNSIPFGWFSFILCVLFTIVPMLEFHGFKNKRNLDTVLSFPISRFKTSLAHFINGYLHATLAYSAMFLLVYVFLEMNTDYFSLGYMLPYYLLSLVCGFVIYSFFSFIFNKANTTADGVILSLAWIIVPFLLLFALQFLTQRIQIEYIVEQFGENNPIKYYHKTIHQTIPALNRIEDYWSFVYMPIYNVSEIFEIFIESNRYKGSFDSHITQRMMEDSYMFAVWGLIGVASAIGYFVNASSKQIERAGERCESLFGYKFVIPLIGYSILITNDATEATDKPTALLMTLILMFIGYVIYQRNIKFKKQHYIMLALAVAVFIFGSMKNSGMLW